MRLNSVIMYLFLSGVSLATIKLWWFAYAKFNRIFPEKTVDPTSSFFSKLLYSFQNELLATCGVAAVYSGLAIAISLGSFFVGKTTIATASDAIAYGIEGGGNLFSEIGSGVKSFFTYTAEGISNYEGAGISPEEAQRLLEEKSLFNIGKNNDNSDYQPSSYYVPNTGSLNAANSAVPIAPANSPAVGQPDPVTAAVVNEQVAVPAPVAEIQQASTNQYAIGNTVTVLPGDNLFKIAQRAYGNGELWRSICNANQGVIANCDNLAAGMRLTIPEPTYREQVVSVVTNSENNPVAVAPAVVPAGLAADGRLYYDVAIPTPVPASIAVNRTMDAQPAAVNNQSNANVASSQTIQQMVTYDTTSLTPVAASIAVQVAPAATPVTKVATTADLLGKPAVDTSAPMISSSR